MSGYRVREGALKLKGKKQKLFKADRPKKEKKKEQEEDKVDPDLEAHAGWWVINNEVDLKGGMNIAIEQGEGTRCYLSALDNGKFTVGGPHPAGEEPFPNEQFALVRTPDEDKISLKTGYGKYVGVNATGELVATAEAIGTKERFIPIFQDGKSAIQAVFNPLFLSMDTDQEGHVFVCSKQAKESEMVTIRTNCVRTGPQDFTPAEDKKGAKECETAYIKMYQHSKVDLKGRCVSVNLNNKRGVKRAQEDGNLHDYLLERRVKAKSDRYC
ncbi:unnamed protein product [Auanema sp. JU1783]|nr:unnamed protein product [Auanema sp. JU1783]